MATTGTVSGLCHVQFEALVVTSRRYFAPLLRVQQYVWTAFSFKTILTVLSSQAFSGDACILTPRRPLGKQQEEYTVKGTFSQ